MSVVEVEPSAAWHQAPGICLCCDPEGYARQAAKHRRDYNQILAGFFSTQAECDCPTDDCPSCSPESYAVSAARHRADRAQRVGA